MTEQNPPSWLQNASHPAVGDRLTLSSLVRQAGVAEIGDLEVTATGSMDLTVAAGSAFISGTTVTHQGKYHVYNDDSVVLTASAADGTNPRKDIVVAQVYDHFYDSSGMNEWALEIVEGTPAASPVAPVTPDNALLLATVTIPAGCTDISATGTVTDDRVQIILASALPPGMIVPYAGSTAPSGWLFCYGQAVSRATYADLFAAIGTTYGSGDGSTTFNVPDLRGRIPVALDNMGGSDAGRLTMSNTLGGTGGEEKHALTSAENATHTHTINHDHASVTSSSNGTHSHAADGDYGLRFAISHGGATNKTSSTGNGDGITFTDIDDDGAHTHTVNLPNYTGSSGSSGSGTAHNNMQPYLLVNYIVKS